MQVMRKACSPQLDSYAVLAKARTNSLARQTRLPKATRCSALMHFTATPFQQPHMHAPNSSASQAKPALPSNQPRKKAA